MGEMRNAYQVLVRKPEGVRKFGRFWRKWEHHSKTGLKEIG
jgi:hypothetical protein